MNCLTWNVRGAGSSTFPRMMRDVILRNKVGLLAVLEPRVSGVRADNIISKAGLNASFKVDVIGFSGGILLMWNKDVYDVKVLESDIQYIHCDVRDNNGASFLFTVVYGSPNMAMRDKLWVSLCRIDASVRGPWLVSGDFDSYVYANEKVVGGP